MGATRVAIAGSSGSIGCQTLEVIDHEGPDRYEVTALAVGSSAEVVIEQARRCHPQLVVVTDPAARAIVASALPGTAVSGDLVDLVELADVVINGVVGFAGLDVTVSTLQMGRRLGLANKESLIAAGPVVQPLRATPGAELIPVDSEHCALHQALRSSHRFDDGHDEVQRLILTASGGPFRGRTLDELAEVSIDEALSHPTWSMGPKITIDSSTLINKGLEVIEAHELFGIGYDQIEVVVHPQSVVHSMVEFSDGSTIAQLSMPDMRLPIGYALGWPSRITTSFGRIDWSGLSRLDFEPPDTTTFRGLGLAYEAGRAGGAAPAWLSAANEVAVEAFLAGRLGWVDIVEVCERTLDDYDGQIPATVSDVITADAAARRVACQVVERVEHQ
ncbi:MAG: 1-deoxy-D-xylulose-5-phosphate reductoisomerase [Ilumatobacter coccineus]|uniref:1-deoxy-D-xylulose 5-phosphate reductoisomerase n=1 Tax=Ilumatobacter coccineus TaxID=467094 RepID=A0A2G6K6T0_9ACTN|nr:MAG: 1-deoxy-D-xylulose-5-phosphate reductoisomerase [Ilumatobacter coccineus]